MTAADSWWAAKVVPGTSQSTQKHSGKGWKRRLQADPSTQGVSPWLPGYRRLSIAQHISKRLQGFPSFRITSWQEGTAKLWKPVQLNWTVSSSPQTGEWTVWWVTVSTGFYSKLKSTLLDQKPQIRGKIWKWSFIQTFWHEHWKKHQPTNHHALREQLPGRIWILHPKVFLLPFKTLSLHFQYQNFFLFKVCVFLYFLQRLSI